MFCNDEKMSEIVAVNMRKISNAILLPLFFVVMCKWVFLVVVVRGFSLYAVDVEWWLVLGLCAGVEWWLVLGLSVGGVEWWGILSSCEPISEIEMRSVNDVVSKCWWTVWDYQINKNNQFQNEKFFIFYFKYFLRSQ